MDQPSLDRLSKLHPKVREEAKTLIEAANSALTANAKVRVVQGYRTFDEQNALYQQGRTTPGKKVTNAPAGSSYHNYGLAIDFALLVDGKDISWDTKKDWDGDKVADWLEVVQVFTKAGWGWGGLFKSIKDYPHFEKIFGKTPKQLLDLHTAGKVDSEGYVII